MNVDILTVGLTLSALVLSAWAVHLHANTLKPLLLVSVPSARCRGGMHAMSDCGCGNRASSISRRSTTARW